MSEQSWDRVPIDAQSIDAPLSQAAVFLVVTIGNGPVALATACSVLSELDDLVKTVGFRDLAGRLSCVAGIGGDLWDRLALDRRPKELRAFQPIAGPVHSAPENIGIGAAEPDPSCERTLSAGGACSVSRLGAGSEVPRRLQQVQAVQPEVGQGPLFLTGRARPRAL